MSKYQLPVITTAHHCNALHSVPNFKLFHVDIKLEKAGHLYLASGNSYLEYSHKKRILGPFKLSGVFSYFKTICKFGYILRLNYKCFFPSP